MLKSATVVVFACLSAGACAVPCHVSVRPRSGGAAADVPRRRRSDTFGVTVTDRKGKLVTDLTQDDFEILEDGKPQTIQYFARGDGRCEPGRCTSG